jgi:hypothetical protein
MGACLPGMGLQFCKMKSLEMGGGIGCTTSNGLSAIELYV